MAIMWKPKYIITDKLLQYNRQIGELLALLSMLKIPNNELVNLKFEAQSLSTFASTSIEGNPLPLTDVKKILKNNPKNIRDSEREITNYNEALKYLYIKIREEKFRLSHQEILHTQSLITQDLLPKLDIGKYRNRAVVIRDPRDYQNIAFIPPDFVDVQKLMSELINFINENLGKLEPIILAGIFHKQNIIIHPFMDGNGRATRLLTTAILGSSSLKLFDFFSLENYYNQNVSKYFQKVGEFGDYYQLQDKIDFTAWLEYFAEGLLDEFKRVMKKLTSKYVNVRLESHHKKILNFIEKNGSITQKEYTLLTSRSLASRKKDFLYLVNHRFIEVRGRRRSTYYVKS